MSQDIKSRLESLFGKVIQGVAAESISKLERVDTEEWDSLAHLNLVISLEEEFGVSINPDQAAEITSFEETYRFVESKR